MLKDDFTITEKSISDYIYYLSSEERAPSTIKKYVRDIRTFADFLGGREVTKELAVAWKEQLKTDHEAVSVNSMIATLNSFCEFSKIGVKLKPLKIQKKTFLSDEKELTRSDYERLLNTAKMRKNERLCLLIQTIGSTGIRVSELQYITVEAVRQGQAVISNKGKIRTVFLSKDLRKILSKYTKKRGIESGRVFITKSGKPLNRSNIWAVMKSLCKLAGVSPTKVFPHNLRRVFAREFYRKTKDIVKLADILGHSDVNATRIYIMQTSAEHRRIIDNLGLVRLVT